MKPNTLIDPGVHASPAERDGFVLVTVGATNFLLPLRAAKDLAHDLSWSVREQEIHAANHVPPLGAAYGVTGPDEAWDGAVRIGGGA